MRTSVLVRANTKINQNTPEKQNTKRDINVFKKVFNLMKVGERIWRWMNERMYTTVFTLALITDFWANWYGYAIVHDWIVLQAFLGMALPFLNLPGVLFFIDKKDLGVRLKLCAVSALAMSMGSTLMLLMVRAGIGVGKEF